MVLCLVTAATAGQKYHGDKMTAGEVKDNHGQVLYKFVKDILRLGLAVRNFEENLEKEEKYLESDTTYTHIKNKTNGNTLNNEHASDDHLEASSNELDIDYVYQEENGLESEEVDFETRGHRLFTKPKKEFEDLTNNAKELLHLDNEIDTKDSDTDDDYFNQEKKEFESEEVDIETRGHRLFTKPKKEFEDLTSFAR